MPTETLGIPVSERIVQNVIDTLAGITVIAGYPITVSDISRPEPQGSKAGEVQVEINETSITWDEETRGHGIDEAFLNLDIVCTILKAESDTTATRTLFHHVAASIRKALYEDVTRGDEAVWTRVTEARPRQDGEEGGTLAVQIHFRTPVGDPHTSV